MKYQKLKLVYGSQEDRTSFLYSSGWCVPLGILSIGTYVKQHHSDIEVEILDSAVLSYDEIRRKLDKSDKQTLSGFSTTILNAKPSLSLAQQAKERGATVLFGGSQAGNLARNFLQNNKSIDYVVIGDGELPASLLAGGESLQNIPGLAYRSSGGIEINPPSSSKVWAGIPLDRRLISLVEKYKQNWSRNNPNSSLSPTNVYFQRGCDWGRCSFCTEPRGTTNGSFEDYFQNLRNLRDKYGFNAFFDISPGPSGRTIEELLKNKPSDLDNVSFRFYTYPHILTEDVIDALEKLNTWEVFIGVESASTNILRKASALKIDPARLHEEKEKFSLSEYHPQIEKSISELRKRSINVKISFALGLEGETKETLQETLQYSRRLIEAGATSIACSTILPLPGTKVYRKIIEHPIIGPKYSASDLVDNWRELRSDWIEHFCQVSYDVIQDIQQDIMGMTPQSTSYGYEEMSQV